MSGRVIMVLGGEPPLLTFTAVLDVIDKRHPGAVVRNRPDGMYEICEPEEEAP